MRVLVVGERMDRGALSELLQMFGHEVSAEPRERLVEAVTRLHPDIVIADVAVPGVQGRGIAEAVAAISPTPRTILVSSRPSHALDHLGIRCLAKPIDLAVLQSLLGDEWDRLA